jgi:hypothetical protein
MMMLTGEMEKIKKMANKNVWKCVWLIMYFYFLMKFFKIILMVFIY